MCLFQPTARFLHLATASLMMVWLATSALAGPPGAFESTSSPDEAFLEQLHRSNSSVVLDATVDMTCAPPTAGMSPPCVVPVGVDPDLVAPDPSGELRIVAFDNDTTLAWVELDGMAPDLVITAWLVFVPPGSPPPAPIFAPIGPGMPPVAAPSAPMAATTARFSEGAGWEPNRLRVWNSGRARVIALLDYNPLKSGQAPLRNGMVAVNQGAAPAGSGAEQPLCCPDAVIPPAPGPRLQPIGSSFLRRFDPATGFQMLGENGRPELVRSPVPVPLIVVIVHIDRTTHGINPGIVIPPFAEAGFPATAGDHYVLGIFPLGGLAMD